MYAIIEESGGQRKVIEGETMLVDLLQGGECKTGEKITFDKVLLIGDESGSTDAKIGAPYLSGASVLAEVVEPMVKGEKLRIFKFRNKGGYRRRSGHRQRYTKVKITSLKG